MMDDAIAIATAACGAGTTLVAGISSVVSYRSSLARLASKVPSDYPKQRCRPSDSDDPTTESPERWGWRGVVSVVAHPVACYGPSLALAGLSLLLLRDPERWSVVLPAVFSQYRDTSTRPLLPPHPTTMGEAFRLGAAYEKFQRGDTAAAVALAGEAAGRPVTAVQLAEMEVVVREIDGQRSLAQRIKSAFSLANILGVLSASGIAVTLGPALFVVGRRLGFTGFISGLVKRAVHLLPPLALPAVSCLAAQFLIEGSRYAKSDSNTGTLLAFAGWAIFMGAQATIPSFTVVAVERQGREGVWAYLPRPNQRILGVFGLIVSGASAILHQSTLLGYASVAHFASLVGFQAFSNGLCTWIGFDGNGALVSAAAGCGLVGLARVALHVLAVDSRYAAPFLSAMSTIGTSIYLLAIEILFYTEYRHRRHAVRALYAGSLIAVVSTGSLLGLTDMRNVGLTYVGIYMFSEYSMLTRYSSRGSELKILHVFSMCVIGFMASVWLSRHPEFIIALYGGSAV